MNTLTPKQERFTINLFSGMSQREAWIQAGYSDKYALAIIDKNACALANQGKIQVRIKELQAKVESDKIMSVTERKERLSEIARARLTQFMELGKDGSWVNLGEETPNTAAIQEIHSRTEYDDNGEKPTVHTSVKLHSPIQAIDLLNKMEKLYSDAPTVNVDNRKIEIHVNSENTKKLAERIMLGERTDAEG